MIEWWRPTGAWFGKTWHGPDQVEDKSPENVARCYRYMRSRPYTSYEDAQRLALAEDAALEQARVDRAERLLGKDDNE
jgi:hypothetical protein